MWFRQERRGSKTRVKQWRWRNSHGFRVCSGAFAAIKYSDGEEAGQPRSLSTQFRTTLTSTQVLLSGHLYISGAQIASRGGMARGMEGSPELCCRFRR